MKCLFIVFLIFFKLISFSQAQDTLQQQSGKTSRAVTFITKLDIANATKDGIYLNGYVVNINYEEAKKLDGKKIKVSGKVTIVKGLKNQPKDTIRQGREEDTKHIRSPKIEIIND